MKRFSLSLAALSLLAGAAVIMQQAVAVSSPQGVKKKPAAGVKKPAAQKKPAAAPPARKGGPIVLGTTQLPGDFGQLGTTYTIGARMPLNFTLNSAEYTLTPVVIGRTVYNPKEDEKLLVLHYTVHNPNPRDTRYYWGEIDFTAVDANDVNRKFITAAAREGQNEPLMIQLKPAQKLDAWTAIRVPGQGVVPKLIVERERGAPVIRYDLRGKVKPLAAPFVDPSDATGATAATEIVAQPAVWYPLSWFDARLDSVAYTAEKLGGRAPGPGKRYFTAIVSIKNRAPERKRYYWGDFEAVLYDANGEKTAYSQMLLKPSSDERVMSNLEPGEEAKVRFALPIAENAEAKTLNLQQRAGIYTSRRLVFDVASMPK